MLTLDSKIPGAPIEDAWTYHKNNNLRLVGPKNRPKLKVIVVDVFRFADRRFHRFRYFAFHHWNHSAWGVWARLCLQQSKKFILKSVCFRRLHFCNARHWSPLKSRCLEHVPNSWHRQSRSQPIPTNRVNGRNDGNHSRLHCGTRFILVWLNARGSKLRPRVVDRPLDRSVSFSDKRLKTRHRTKPFLKVK